MRRFIVLLPPLLAACATAPARPPIPTDRVVAAPVGEVRSRLEVELRALGLEPAATAGGLVADVGAAGAPSWADCPRIIVQDRDSDVYRSDWASPQARGGTVTVGLRPEGGGTAVSVTTRFAATYTDRYRNLPVAGPCASLGELERRLLDAAARAG